MHKVVQTAANVLVPEEQLKAQGIKAPTTKYKPDPVLTMKALEWRGKNNMKLVDRPRPLITDPGDVVIRTTCATVCGSDLHLYNGEMMGLEKGDILGHEGVGIVEQVGPDVKTIKKGDRVALSFDIACGECVYCKKQEFTLCITTNPNPAMDLLYGHRISGAFGYTHLLGGYDGAQAEYVRIPIADVNCLKIPDELSDEKAILLSDIACTGWHANELGEVKTGDIVAIWGCGPLDLWQLCGPSLEALREYSA